RGAPDAHGPGGRQRRTLQPPRAVWGLQEVGHRPRAGAARARRVRPAEGHSAITRMFAALAGIAAGLVHVLSGPDHLAAVAPLATDRDRPQWQAGFQWGLGHTAGVLAIGLLLIWFRQWLPIERISAYSERIVGVVLLAIGIWG